MEVQLLSSMSALSDDNVPGSKVGMSAKAGKLLAELSAESK